MCDIISMIFSIREALRDLVPFILEKRKKHPWMSATLVKFTKSNTPLWMFLRFLSCRNVPRRFLRKILLRNIENIRDNITWVGRSVKYFL